MKLLMFNKKAEDKFAGKGMKRTRKKGINNTKKFIPYTILKKINKQRHF